MTRSAKLMFIFLILAFGLSFASQTLAQEKYGQEGSYLGLAGVYSVSKFKEQEIPGFNATMEYDSSLGADVKLGFNLSPRFAMEMELLYNSGFEYSDTLYYQGQAADVKAEISMLSLFFNIKGILSTGRFQPYGVVGVGYSSADADITASARGLSASEGLSDSDFGAKFGAGIDCYITPKFAAFVEVSYLIPGADALKDMNFVPIYFGVMFRF